MNLAVDGSDNLWVVTNQGLFVKPAGQTQFLPAQPAGLAFAQIAADGQGRMWATGDTPSGAAGLVRLPRPGHAQDRSDDWHLVHPSLFMPMFDRQDRLWYGAVDGLSREPYPTLPSSDTLAGSQRVASPAAPASAPEPEKRSALPRAVSTSSLRAPSLEHLSSEQGLSGDQVLVLFQDREGGVWVGTNAGLDRLRETAISRFEFPQRPSNVAMARGNHQDLWFTVRSQGLFHWDPDLDSQALTRVDTGSALSLTAVHVAPGGVVWLGGREGLWRLDPDGSITHPMPPGLAQWRGAVVNIVQDHEGALWLNAQSYSVMRLKDGQWTRMSGTQGLPLRMANCLAVDPAGAVWLGYADGQLYRILNGETTRYSAQDGLRVGGVLALEPAAGGIWVAGERGVQHLGAGGWRELRAERPGAFEGVSGIIAMPGGELWINGAAGIARAGASEVKRALAGDNTPVRPTLYDTGDGLPGRAETSWPLQTAMRAPDGRLWFTLSSAVVTLDPRTLSPAAPPPHPRVVRLLSDRQRWPLDALAAVDVPAGTSALRVEYTAMTLGNPEKVRFRHRLTGLEANWRDAGNRREAAYTNLGPGTYTFEVQAALPDGTWGATTSRAQFTIAPTLVQSAGFRAACGVVVALVLLALGRWRSRHLSRRAAERLQAQLDERGRVAQDLHDTLLQGFQGLVLKLQRAVSLMPPDSDQRERMQAMVEQADTVLAEGRDRVADLRSDAPEPSELERWLRRVGQELEDAQPMHFGVQRSGQPWALPAPAHAEIKLVAREAIFNAFRHASATRIEVALRYRPQALELTVIDDGVGLDGGVLDQGARSGHWGLSGMRERMKRVGGRLEIHSTPGRGTRISIVWSRHTTKP